MAYLIKCTKRIVFLVIYTICILLNFICLTQGYSDQYRLADADIESHELVLVRLRRQDVTPLANDTFDNSTSTTMMTPSTVPVASATGDTRVTFPGDIVKEKDYKYYAIQINNDQQHFQKLWKDLRDLNSKEMAVRHITLSDSHRVAATVKLHFPFRFYGHIIDNITIATGGFLYMSPYLHSFITRTQYIAPLMANFDSSIKSNSDIYYYQGDDTMYVEWSNLHLQDQTGLGSFTFQVILYSDHSIAFVYKELPADLSKISNDRHPVKVGMSDAYNVNFDKSLKKLGNYNPMIFKYHTVKINRSQLKSGVVVNIRPLATCNMESKCSECIKKRFNFDCRWCPSTLKCSDGFDWHRHEWLVNGCHNDASSTRCPKSKYWIVAVVLSLLIVAVIIGVAGWVVYAYRNPTSRSGLWLIKHRPSQMKDTFAKMKFWKRGSSGQERYGLETTA